MSTLKPYEQVICTVDLQKLEAQRDALLAAAEAVWPYIRDRTLDDFIDIENVRVSLRQAIDACKEA